MAIFTRDEVNKIMSDEAMSAEDKTERIFALHGRALDNGYIAKSAAKSAQDDALKAAKDEWEKSVKIPDPKESEDYKALRAEYDGYKAMQKARTSEDFAGVKSKFFETVYGMIDHSEQAKPVKDQMDKIRTDYAEYFEQAPEKKAFGGGTVGTPPRGNEGIHTQILSEWGYNQKGK